jgi:hypothetical protein
MEVTRWKGMGTLVVIVLLAVDASLQCSRASHYTMFPFLHHYSNYAMPNCSLTGNTLF